MNGASSYANSFAMSPEPNDSDANLDSLENSLKYVNPFCNIPMPVLEDGLSSEHGSDTENNNNMDSSSSPVKASEGEAPTDEAESSADEPRVKVDEELDTDHETDRLLGEQRLLEQHLGNIDANQVRMSAALANCFHLTFTSLLQNMRVLRCANGQIIKSPKTGYNKTDSVLRHGVGAQSNEPVSDGDDGYYPSGPPPDTENSPKTPTIIREKKGLKRNTEGELAELHRLSQLARD